MTATRIIAFDFDGTIADTRDAFVKVTNELAAEFGYSPITQERLAQLGNFNLVKIIRQSEISLWKVPFLIRRLKKEIGNEIPNVKPIAGIEKALVELKEQGYKLGIITSNSEENVTAFLRQHSLQNIFDFIFAGASLNGKHRIIRQLIKREGYLPKAVVFVGDEVRDVKAARKTQEVVAIAVTWGFHSEADLEKGQPNFMVHSPAELVSAIRSLPKL